MSEYTQVLSGIAETLSLEEEDYSEKLLDIAKMFRGFDEALTAFILRQGYSGNVDNIDDKAEFISEKFINAKITPLPRDIKEWFIPSNVKRSRKRAFQICFAFELGVTETDDFFKRVWFERSFDCHQVDEAIYYFCIKNGMSYGEADAIIKKIPKAQREKMIPDTNALYTRTIVNELDKITDVNTLLKYMEENIGNFSYNNVTAIKFVRNLWNKIVGKDGFAYKEGQIIDRMLNRSHPNRKKKKDDTCSKEVIDREVKREKELKQDDFVISGENASSWTIYTQIMGLDNKQETQYAPTRSLSAVLEGNMLVPFRVHNCFPDKAKIDGIIRGDEMSSEIIRKMIIFLSFYTFWARKVIEENTVFVNVEESDSERCLYNINKYLTDAGYPEIYPGNPYDWIFLWALNDSQPLEAFRYYIRELIVEKNESENI